MPQKYDDVIIDLAIDEPSRSSPALGQIDKLLKQSALETQSLQVVRRLMLRDMLDRAQVTGVTKLHAAAKHRKELAPMPPSLLEANGNGYHGAEPATTRKKRKAKPKDGKKPRSERIEQVRQYLGQHPGSDTFTIAAALNWRPNQVLKFIKGMAKGQKIGHRQPIVWTLKTNGSSVPTAPTKRTLAGHAPRKPFEVRQQEIRNYLSHHPEAFTVDIAKGIKVNPSDSFRKILRSVAKPLKPTTATQPVQWVLTA